MNEGARGALGLGRFSVCVVVFLATLASAICAEKSVIDLMIVYTEDVLREYSDEDGVVAQAQAGVALANETFRNSEIDLELRLVAVEGVEYEPNGEDMGIDLDHLAKEDGVLDSILQRREETGADLVCLF